MNSEDKNKQKVCFVVMGFGKKTDFESGRTLDLDATYEAIIRPAAEQAGLRCIRADDLSHSGMIDSQMYELLLRAELVIADISTGNVNAVYELGVRHALRPNSTIIMIERGGKLHFDLNHISTFHYEHLGEDIGVREAKRASGALKSLINEALTAEKPDSPVYTYLPGLKRPHIADEQYEELLKQTEAAQEQLSEHLRLGELAQKASRHAEAMQHFTLAREMRPQEAYIVQQLALATYKAEQPSPLEALIDARAIIDTLNPEDSNDPETLGIAASIRKRLWLKTNEIEQLEAAIRLYRRGFEIRRDYYNGENLASCFDYRARELNDPDERLFSRISARKVRQTIVEVLTTVINAPSFADRSDRRWIYATLANCLWALGDRAEGDRYEHCFLGESPADWEVKTFMEGRASVIGGAHV